MEKDRCCGTCRYWNAEGGSDFKERCKRRFRSPFCELTAKPHYADDMKGCLAWMIAKPDELKKRHEAD
jgi:hypothetical protein